jgi:hypothetical protein
LTKVNCKNTDCTYNSKGTCSKEEIDLEYLFQSVGVGCGTAKNKKSYYMLEEINLLNKGE